MALDIQQVLKSEIEGFMGDLENAITFFNSAEFTTNMHEKS